MAGAAKGGGSHDWQRTGAIAGVVATVVAIVAFLLDVGSVFDGGGEEQATASSTTQVRPVSETLCRSRPRRHVVLEGSIEVAGSGDRYRPRTRAHVGDVVTFQLWLRNREMEQDVVNLHARVSTNREPSITASVEVRACGSNTFLLRDSAEVTSSAEPIRLEFLPGSIGVRQKLEGRWATRGGSDDFFSAPNGEALGRLAGSPDPSVGHMTVTVRARVVGAR